MKTSVASVVLGILFLWSGTASAQETYTIKLKNSVEGGSVTVTKEDKTTAKMKITDPNGKVLVDKDDTTTTILEFTETTLKRKGAEAPTLLEREYTKAKANGLADSLVGKVVVIEKKNDSYTFTFKGGEAVTGLASMILKKEFDNKTSEFADMNQLMAPKTAVKLGETWNPDLAPITKALSSGGMLDIDLAKATLVGKLLKVYKKDGKQFGEMQFKMDFPIKAIGKGAQKMVFPKGAQTTALILLDTCIDGSSETGTMKSKMHISGEATIAGSTVVMDILTDSVETHRDLGKK